jgi:hypothetical protein
LRWEACKAGWCHYDTADKSSRHAPSCRPLLDICWDSR